jgi:hypothetical protein
MANQTLRYLTDLGTRDDCLCQCLTGMRAAVVPLANVSREKTRCVRLGLHSAGVRPM